MKPNKLLKNSGIIIALLLFFPLGLFLLWKFSDWSKKTKGVLSAVFAIFFIYAIASSNVKPENIAISIADQQESYDINTEIPIKVSVTPENANMQSAEYISDEGISFDNDIITTGSEKGTYTAYIEIKGVKSNLLTISVTDFKAEEERIREEEEKRLAEEQAAKEAEEKRLAEERAAKEAEEKKLAEEQAAKEAEEKRLAEEQAAKETDRITDSSENSNNESQQQTSTTYVLNTNTKKFHYSSCSSVKTISQKNYETSNSSREELIASGYEPCGKCHP